MAKDNRRRIELLAPARDADIAIAAINHGADAVYMGASKFGARAMAGNSIDDIRRAVDYAHQFNAKVYATVNTIIYDNELKQVEALMRELYDAGVDAVITQDMGMLRLDLPAISLHSSTQCDLRTPEKAKFLESLGFSQLVLARELGYDEISAIHDAVNVPLEAFVHGALCVSYSGRCQVSQVTKGRSANRGECAQLCRLPYDLIDDKGLVIVKNKHLLSLKDFNMSRSLEDLLKAGVSSLKIEGRLKDEGYVKNVVAYYRKALDAVIARHPEEYVRSSVGVSRTSFDPVLAKSFNRGFTSYFFTERKPKNGHKMAATETPKSMGEPIGESLGSRGKSVAVRTKSALANGDGLSYFNENGEYTGFRVNKALRGEVLANQVINVPAGAKLFRTFDKEFEDQIAKSSTARKIWLDASLAVCPDNMLSLTLSDERGNRVTKSIVLETLDYAKQDQSERQIATLAKLGNTIYELRDALVPGEYFIPQSALANLRRDAIEALDAAQRMTYHFDMRRKEDKSSPCFADALTYADNVANHLAAQLYRDHGVKQIENAAEVSPESIKAGDTVMHTRYCIRRELGACKKDKNGKFLPDKLFLRSGNIMLGVECDCKNCEMHIITLK